MFPMAEGEHLDCRFRRVHHREQLPELFTHDDRTADTPAQHGFVEDSPDVISLLERVLGLTYPDPSPAETPGADAP